MLTLAALVTGACLGAIVMAMAVSTRDREHAATHLRQK